MAGSCGGVGTTQRVMLQAKPTQLVGQLEQRTRTTIRAAMENDNPVFLTFDERSSHANGFPLYPGESYTLDDRAARVAVYGVGPFGGDKIVYVLTEGA
jgi:hypothetical protein